MSEAILAEPSVPINERGSEPPQKGVAFADGYAAGPGYPERGDAYSGDELIHFLQGVAQRERDDYADSLDVDSWPDDEARR